LKNVPPENLKSGFAESFEVQIVCPQLETIEDQQKAEKCAMLNSLLAACEGSQKSFNF